MLKRFFVYPYKRGAISMTRSRLLTLIAVAVLAIAPVPAVLAQQSTPPAADQSTSSYSETELRSFAVAVLGVQKINTTYLPRYEAASSAKEQEQVLEAARKEVAQVVQEQGISMDRFHQILGDTQADPGLADKVRQLIRESK
jgi:hypothetical protein